MTDEHVINTMMIEEMRIEIEIEQTGGQANEHSEPCVCVRYQNKRTDEKWGWQEIINISKITSQI